jgi:hypothetical protein
VFVEDTDLLRVAALPFTREVGLVSGAVRPLEPGDVEGALRRRAEQARRSLADLAESARVKWSFRVARGTLQGEVLAAAGRADVVVTGERPRAGRGRPRVAAQTVTAVFEPTEAGHRALSIALRLAEGQLQALSLLVPAAAGSDLARLRELAAQALRVAPGLANVELLSSRQAGEVIRLSRQRASRALVLPASSLSDGDEQVRLLVEESTCPLVLVL